MLGIVVIVFREILEAARVVSIAAALLVALFAGEIASIEVLLFVVTLLGFGGASRLLQRRHPRSAAAVQPTQTV